MKLTQERLREVLRYDPETGQFSWLRHTGRAAAGEIAGCLQSNGYWRVSVDGRYYLAHRLAWLFMTGAWPPEEIDHRDRDRLNNCWPNLRLATHAQNGQNQGARKSKSGRRGVHWDAVNRKWNARIKHNGKMVNLGRFSDIDLAEAARRAAERRLFTHAESCA